MREHHLLPLPLLLVLAFVVPLGVATVDQVQEALGDELPGRGLVPGRAVVVGHVVGERELVQLGVQQVRLVEEEDDAGLDKEGVVHNGLEELEALRQPVGLPVFQQDLQVRKEKKRVCFGYSPSEIHQTMQFNIISSETMIDIFWQSEIL